LHELSRFNRSFCLLMHTSLIFIQAKTGIEKIDTLIRLPREVILEDIPSHVRRSARAGIEEEALRANRVIGLVIAKRGKDVAQA